MIGINPEPGVLARHAPSQAARLLAAVADGRAETEARTMVEATSDDGQQLLALNEASGSPGGR